MKKNSNKGFTLIELLVVIAIIGLLSSVVFASLNSARVKGRIATAQSTLKSFSTALSMCLNDGVAMTPVAGTAPAAAGDACTPSGGTAFTWPTLPTGWAYTTAWTFSQGASFSVTATGDSGVLIQCSEGGCNTTLP